MRSLSSIIRTKRCAALIALLLLNGCAIQLAPLYDQALVSGITSANSETMQLLASVSEGTDANTFNTREDKYNKAIGDIDALALQANARPVPSNDVESSVEKLFKQRATTAPSSIEPSYHALQNISATLVEMRDTDKKQGLQPLEAQGFKNLIVSYMDDVLTYEDALQR